MLRIPGQQLPKQRSVSTLGIAGRAEPDGQQSELRSGWCAAASEWRCLGWRPRQPFAEARPQTVVAAAGPWPAVAVAQQLILWPVGATAPGVLEQTCGLVECDRLPAQGLALLAEPNQAPLRVHILQSQGEAATAPARSLGMKP